MNKYTIPCGRLYDPETDTSNDVFPCDSWARWEVEPRTGLLYYACGSHINQVLADLVQDRRADLVIRDMRQGE